ncbi:MAG TPA: serine hydrolase domain-containing protein [Streptosporangiaceae bacterium]|jgi:D-alanyl-D-alanine carboxypeptidase
MRYRNTRKAQRTYRNRLAAVTVACALLGTAGVLPGAAASASVGPSRQNGAALRAALRADLTHYLATRHKAEHISAVGLRVTYPGNTPSINLAAGTTRYHGGPPVSTSALWQVGSNTKAFTAVILLQLEAEGKLSINDPLGRWLPQYPAWRHVTIRQLLNMTSRIPDYALQPAFDAALAKDPGTRFTAARLISYAVGVPLAPQGFYYSNTNYILIQMIIEKVTHDSYADQLTKRIITPLRLRNLCYAPYTCPRADVARMPAGYFFEAGAPPLLGKPMPRLAETWTQAAGGIVSSLADLTTWERALYQGQELPPAQQHQLESLISETTGQPISSTTTADPNGYALGLTQLTYKPLGTVWWYRGGPLGYRVEHFYFPSSGLIIALATNSSVNNNNDGLFSTAVSVYQTLEKAGAVHTG